MLLKARKKLWNCKRKMKWQREDIGECQKQGSDGFMLCYLFSSWWKLRGLIWTCLFIDRYTYSNWSYSGHILLWKASTVFSVMPMTTSVTQATFPLMKEPSGFVFCFFSSKWDSRVHKKDHPQFQKIRTDTWVWVLPYGAPILSLWEQYGFRLWNYHRCSGCEPCFGELKYRFFFKYIGLFFYGMKLKENLFFNSKHVSCSMSLSVSLLPVEG